MHERKTITGAGTDEIWQQISQELTEDLLEYNVLIRHGEKEISLDIDIDLGGGFEGGYAETALVSPLPNTHDFNFAIHKEGLGDEIGKFFGMQDVKIGFESFDKQFIVKTNDAQKVKVLFADDAIRSILISLEEPFTLGTTSHDHNKVLEFSTDVGLTDTTILKNVYTVFYFILNAIDKNTRQ